MKKAELYIGCCGFRWSQEKYFNQFLTVEIQHTFYQPPQLTTLERWRKDAPQSFEFTIKAWQRITHAGTSPTYRKLKKPLSEEEAQTCGNFQPSEVVWSAMKTTLECAKVLKADKILFQCPAAFIPSEQNIENFRNFFTEPRPKNIHYLWEPRGKWPEALIYELCEELNLIHVVNPFMQTSVTRGLYYYRIHGRSGKQMYSDEDLKELSDALIPGEKTYVLFNNVYMIKDAERFQTLFSGENLQSPNKLS